MKSFVYTGLPARVVFGVGSLAQLPAELERLGAKRALVLSTPGRAASVEAIARSLGERCAGFFPGAVMHTPVETAVEARRLAAQKDADCCVAVGGGSTIGLGKAVALTTGLPVLAVPTTYSGSEMTPIQGFTEGGLKRTQRDPKMLPRTVIYDPQLTLGLPASTSAASGMNAIAHCVEALYAQDANPVVSMMAEEGIRALAAALPVLVREPANLEARSEALYGAWLAGISLGSAGMALHHKLCHTLGGTWNLPHAETHAIVLPHAARYNRDAAPEAMARIARALGARDAPAGLYDLVVRLGLKVRLADLGMQAADLERAADLATQSPYPNPAPVERRAVRALLEAAYAGRRPE